jgi:hypothetical protein
VAVFGLVTALMSAGFALAGDPFEEPGNDPTTCEPVDGTVVPGDELAPGDEPVPGEEPAPGDEPVEEPAPGDEPVEEPAPGDEPVEEPAPGDEPEGCAGAVEGSTGSETPGAEEVQTTDVAATLEATPERIAACTEAAGLTAADAPEDKPVPGELKGLENAIAHVLWNCLRNDNDGLVNALEHLQANLERKLAREELKAQRKAEREAAKAARKAAHDAAKAARELTRSS